MVIILLYTFVCTIKKNNSKIKNTNSKIKNIKLFILKLFILKILKNFSINK